MQSDVQAITIRLPIVLYERLRRQAFERRRSQTDIIQAALEPYLDQLEEQDGSSDDQG